MAKTIDEIIQFWEEQAKAVPEIQADINYLPGEKQRREETIEILASTIRIMKAARDHKKQFDAFVMAVDSGLRECKNKIYL